MNNGYESYQVSFNEFRHFIVVIVVIFLSRERIYSLGIARCSGIGISAIDYWRHINKFCIRHRYLIITQIYVTWHYSWAHIFFPQNYQNVLSTVGLVWLIIEPHFSAYFLLMIIEVDRVDDASFRDFERWNN